MKNPRILMVIAVFYPYVGGAEKQAEKLAYELIKKDIDVKVVTGRWSNGLTKYETLNGLKIIRNRTNFIFFKKDNIDTSASFFKELPKANKPKSETKKIILKKIFVRLSVYIYQLTLFLYLLCNRKSYDIIHVHQVLYPAFISTICASILKKPVIAKVGSSGFNSDINHIKKLPGGNIQLKYIIKRIGRLVCTTKRMQEDFISEGMDKNKIMLIRNGVSTEEFKRQYEKCDNLAYVGRFIKSKDLETLIIAFSKIIKEGKINLKLTLIGDGPGRDGITRLINNLRLNDNITITGMVKNPAEILKAADAFVFPSLIEGLSNSLIEAMASGLPCIATNIPGNTEVLSDGWKKYDIKNGTYLETEFGILFKPSDVGGLEEALKYILNNRNARKRIGENAHRRIKNEFDIRSIAESYIKLYEELTGQV